MDTYKNTPLWNNQLPIEERLNYLLENLSLEEKITCLTTGCPDIPRLGIKASFMGGEAAHGIEARHDQAFNAGEPEPTTSFTQPTGMSGSFDRELIKECGKAVGEEARALFTRNQGGSLCRWAPTVDMERDPRWGRNEESYGEDPYLTGEMSSAYIQGMKGEDPFYLQCGATLKHFYANNVETDRVKASSSVDERNKYEYYLEPFRKAIMEGGAEAIMTSYNEINGVPAVVNGEVQRIVKNIWGLPGHVVCDGGDFQQTVTFHKYFETHAESIAYGLKAGIDCFTDDREVVYAAAREALQKGLITEKDIDRSLRNSFRTRIRLGFFDKEGQCPYTDMGEEYINNEEHQSVCRKMAEESVVLLKNEGEILPFKPEETASLAVIGPLSNVWNKDWYGGIPPYDVTVLDGIKKAFPKTKISCQTGLSKIQLCCNGKYIVLDAQGRLKLGEKQNAETFVFTDWGCGSSTLVAESNGQFVTLEEGSYLIKADKKEAFGWFIREAWNFKETDLKETARKENSHKQFYLDSWNGRKVTIDKDGFLAVIKTQEVMPGEGDDEKLNCESHALWQGDPSVFTMEVKEDGLQEAVKAAAIADKAVVILGSNPVINSKEEIDRTTLALPPAQQELADRILEANPNTVIILVTNYPYSINKLNEYALAILYSASGSQELGNGIAAVLSGKVSPAGRLPMTWYRSDEDLPDMNNYDIISAKRTYQYFDGKVLYPFGYGLSYTEFTYGAMEVLAQQDRVSVKIPITNIGKVTGDEVVQLYVHKEESRVKRPVSQLKAFTRIKNLAPGETKVIEFTVAYENLQYFDVISRKMILETGTYLFMAGASSKDIRQIESLSLKGEKAPNRNPFAATQAMQYDAYENCFLHRGTKGHTMEGLTCVIPGKAGEETDFVDNTLDKTEGGVLFYKDFVFTKQPNEFVMNCCALEDGEITISCVAQDGNKKICKIDIQKADNEDFSEQTKILPEDFAPLNENMELQIAITGKIKLAYFYFK